MAHRTWMHGLWLGLVGFALATGCVVKSDDDDGTDDDAAAGGEDSGGGTGGAGRGGSGGATGGSGGSGATGGSTGGSGATGGTTGGTGATGGTSGTGGMDQTPVCDDEEPMSTPYPDCEPRSTMDDCEDCIQRSCCEESRICFGYDPGNVCGFGGPTTGDYADLSEFDCYRFCAEDQAEATGAYDEDVQDFCFGACVTPMCAPIIGNATQDIVICMDTSCEQECYLSPDT